MTFKELQDAVLADRFDPSQRGDVGNWLNHRYWWLWSLKPWTFKTATATVTVTAGSQAVTGTPADLLRVVSLLNADGTTRLSYLEPAVFFTNFYDSTADNQGTPEFFTIVAGTIYVGPTSGETSAAYQLVYEREFSMLVDAADVPALPTGAHFALVHGANAEGLKLQNDPTWQAFETDFNNSIQILDANYLDDQVSDNQQYGADGAEQWL